MFCYTAHIYNVSLLLQKVVSIGAKRRRIARRKKQKSFENKMKQELKIRRHSGTLKELHVLQEQKSSIQNLYDKTVQKMNVLHKKYEMLKLLLSNMKIENQHTQSKFLKSIRADQLTYAKDELNSDVILGKGMFGICKLMFMNVSGEIVKVASKHYQKEIPKETIFKEASFLSQLSHIAFPYIFGVAVIGTEFTIVLEFCAMSEGKKHSLTIHQMLELATVSLSEFEWLKLFMNCTDGFGYLYSKGIIHNDIKADNILIMKYKCGSWYPKIIDLNKAVYVDKVNTSLKREICLSERKKCKLLYPHKDPALYDGLYLPCQQSDVYSFGYLAKQVAKKTESELMLRFATTCTSTYRRPDFITLTKDIKDILNS